MLLWTEKKDNIVDLDYLKLYCHKLHYLQFVFELVSGFDHASLNHDFGFAPFHMSASDLITALDF